MAATVPDRAALAARIQGFGNVNPPPLKDDTPADLAKKAVGNLGGMLGEEVALTVQDFREKGAVGAVKDAVADAGDILIDGVAGVFGWLRGDAPEEEEHAAADAASKVLANGPNGAAYGVSQASPTGGLNAVWVMPDEADPATLAQLAAQSNSAAPPPGAPHIQPYQAPRSAATTIAPSYQPGMQISPGGPVIQPYQPSGPGVGIAGFSPGAFRPPGSQQPIAPFTPGAPYGMQGGMPGGMPMPGASPAASPQSGVKAYVERIAKGEVLVSPEVAQRLTRQCGAAKATAKQLGEMVCERARRLYLGLDGGDPAEADAALARMLALVDALAQLDGDLAKQAVAHIKTGISEELTSLNSSAKHQAAALPMLQRLGLAKGGAPAAAAAESVDLLGGGGAPAAAHADLLGTGDAPAPAAEADLLGTGGGSSGGAALGGLFDASPAPAPQSDANALAGLNFGAAPPAAAAVPAAAPGAMPGTMGAGATMSQQKSGDAFSFVGAELSKAKA